MRRRIEHQYSRCRKPCFKRDCPYCNLEILHCKICDCEEAELLESCPGYKLDAESKDAIVRGNVFDFELFKQARDEGLNEFFTLLRRSYSPSRRCDNES